MKVTICGISDPMNFETENGTRIEGIKLHYTYKRDGVTGVAAGDKFVIQRILSTIPQGLGVGDYVNLDYSEKGKLVGIDVLTAASEADPFTDKA